MNFYELSGLACSLGGVAYGFGVTGNRITVLRRNVDDIAKMHRDTLRELHDVNVCLAELKKDIEYIKEK